MPKEQLNIGIKTEAAAEERGSGQWWGGGGGVTAAHSQAGCGKQQKRSLADRLGLRSDTGLLLTADRPFSGSQGELKHIYSSHKTIFSYYLHINTCTYVYTRT